MKSIHPVEYVSFAGIPECELNMYRFSLEEEVKNVHNTQMRIYLRKEIGKTSSSMLY